MLVGTEFLRILPRAVPGWALSFWSRACRRAGGPQVEAHTLSSLAHSGVLLTCEGLKFPVGLPSDLCRHEVLVIFMRFLLFFPCAFASAWILE
jgi:hypothetical protein